MTNPYPPDSADNHPNGYGEDDGTMPDNIEALANQVVGHRIVKAEKSTVKASEFKDVTGYSFGGRWDGTSAGFVLTLDNGRRVILEDSSDCCAYTELESFLLHPDKVDHIITGVSSTEGYTKWHIFADMGDVLELQVGWSPGNPFYYGYGFTISVSDVIEVES